MTTTEEIKSNRNRIVSKIEKLMAMAKDGAATQNEKQVAEKLLKQLADQYLIDLEDIVKGIDRRNGWDREIGRKDSFLVFTETNNAYIRIAQAVAKYTGVYLIISHRPRPGVECMHPLSFIFVGENSQCEIADYFTTYLIKSLRKVSAHSLMRKSKQSIEDGFALEIYNRLFELWRQQQAVITRNVGSLILRKDEAIAQYIHQKIGPLGSYVGGNMKEDKSGIGRSMARDIALNKGINGSNGGSKQLR